MPLPEEPEPEVESSQEADFLLAYHQFLRKAYLKGWTMEQWAYYGEKWLEQKRGK
ncbi:MAG: hypothetical protein Ct9H90mP14_2390 [Methanobacteriota archaeon]|nr:MAG: hypothetical protein Ct9H90mP14_2390 [Euryarchaeota archaeon]